MSEILEDEVVTPQRAVFQVAPSDITPTYRQVVGFFAPVFAEAKTHTPEDVWKILMARQAQLWVQWNITDQVIEAAFVTEAVVYPQGVWIRLWLGGAARDAKVEYHAVRGALTLWAKQSNARGFEITGRHGWLRKFPDAVVEGLMMRLTFDG